MSFPKLKVIAIYSRCYCTITASSAKVLDQNHKQDLLPHCLDSNSAFVSSLLLMKINLLSMALYQPQWHKGQRYRLIKYTSAIYISHGSMRVWDLLIKSVIMFTHHKHFACRSAVRWRDNLRCLTDSFEGYGRIPQSPYRLMFDLFLRSTLSTGVRRFSACVIFKPRSFYKSSQSSLWSPSPWTPPPPTTVPYALAWSRLSHSGLRRLVRAGARTS